jgi:hypothetical protein
VKRSGKPPRAEKTTVASPVPATPAEAQLATTGLAAQRVALEFYLGQLERLRRSVPADIEPAPTFRA